MRSHPLTSSFVVRICVYHTTVLWNFHALIGGLCVSENGHWARFCVLNRQCKNHIVRSRHFLSSLIKTWSSYTSPLDCRLRKVIDSMCRSFSYVFLLLRDIKMSTSYFYCSLLTFCRFSTLLPSTMAAPAIGNTYVKSPLIKFIEPIANGEREAEFRASRFLAER